MRAYPAARPELREIADDDVRAIRATYRHRRRPYMRELAAQHGVSVPTVWAIIHGRRYKGVQ